MNVGDQTTIGEATVACGAPPGALALGPCVRGMAKLAPHVRTTRMLGSAGTYVHAWLMNYAPFFFFFFQIPKHVRTYICPIGDRFFFHNPQVGRYVLLAAHVLCLSEIPRDQEYIYIYICFNYRILDLFVAAFSFRTPVLFFTWSMFSSHRRRRSRKGLPTVWAYVPLSTNTQAV